MRKILCVLGLAVLVLGIGAFAGRMNLVMPRVVPCGSEVVFLFDNETGVAQSAILVLFDEPTSIEATDIAVFGGAEVTEVQLLGGGTTARITATVVPGGTLQIRVSGGTAGDAKGWWLTGE